MPTPSIRTQATPPCTTCFRPRSFTGYPALHNLLSATVIARDCMSADAYATAFMVMGLERAKAFVEARPDLDAYFIYADSTGSYQTYMTEGMARFTADQSPE